MCQHVQQHRAPQAESQHIGALELQGIHEAQTRVRQLLSRDGPLTEGQLLQALRRAGLKQPLIDRPSLQLL